MNPEITKYIEKKYSEWLDYTDFHCNVADISEESIDVLNEVLLSLLQKDERKLMKMYSSISGEDRELDFYILRMIKLNVYSQTSPYQKKYKNMPQMESIETPHLNIIDFNEETEDEPAKILEQTRKLREIIAGLNLSEKAMEIFKHRFFNGKSYSEWSGAETKKQLYSIYYRTIKQIKEKIKNER